MAEIVQLVVFRNLENPGEICESYYICGFNLYTDPFGDSSSKHVMCLRMHHDACWSYNHISFWAVTHVQKWAVLLSSIFSFPN